MSFYFKQDIFVLFLHNSYSTSAFPDCRNLVGADCMGNLRWANTEQSMHFRKTNMNPSVHFRKANTDPSVHFRKGNTEFLLPVLFPTPNFTSKFTPSFISNITINLSHHDEFNIISQVTVNYAHCTFVFCTQFSFLQKSRQLTVPSQWNLQEKTDTLNVSISRSPIQILTQLSLA